MSFLHRLLGIANRGRARPYTGPATGSGEDPNILVARSPVANAPVAIVFSSVNSNGFSFYKLFEQFAPQLTRIYVRDPMDAWYAQGTGGQFHTRDDLLAGIGDIVAELSPVRTMTFGASMGGYASLAMNVAANIDLCVATSPQTILDTRLPHTPASEVATAYRDLRDPLGAQDNKNTVLYFGAADFVDIYNVARTDWRSATLVPIADRDHLVATHLTKTGVYTDLIAAFCKGTSQKAVTHTVDIDNRCMNPQAIALINRIVEAAYLSSGEKIAPLLSALEDLPGNWADGYHLCAKATLAEHDIEGALRYARQAARMAQHSVTISDSLGSMLARAGLMDEAEAAYENSLRLRPKHYGAMCALAELWIGRGEQQRAIDLLQSAIEIRPRLSRAQSLLASTGAVD
jgi:tetratricopeptide (TPR) repeat protein